jgi:hypothetical protein
MRLLIPLSVSFPEIPPEDLARAGFRKTMTALRAFIYKEKRHPVGWRWTVTYFKMVESAGIEPASANPLQQVLHT